MVRLVRPFPCAPFPCAPSGIARSLVCAMVCAIALAPAASWAQYDGGVEQQPTTQVPTRDDDEEQYEEQYEEEYEEDFEEEPLEERWYDTPLYVSDVVVDAVLIRPVAAITFLAGAALFVPAAMLTAPNGMDSIRDAYDRFVNEPGQYLWGRPLGEL